MINNIINNKNIKLYFNLFLILLLLFFLYLINYYTKKENFEKNNTSQKNIISKNINNIQVPADFIPTHPWSNAKSGLDIADNQQEHYLYKDDEKIEKYDKDSSQFTRSFTCRPSITGVFTECGPYSFNACGPIKPSTSDYHKTKDKKYRKHRNDGNNRNDKDEYRKINRYFNHNRRHRHNNHDYQDRRNSYDNENNDSNNNSRNQDQLYYDEYMNDLDGY